MKYNCDIVRDLLPLYQDDIVSDASKLMVKEHLEECEKCTYFFEDMQKEVLVNQNDEYEEKKDYVTLAKRIRKTKWYWRLITITFISILVWTALMYSEGYRLKPQSAACVSNGLIREGSILDTIKVADDKIIYIIRDGFDGGLYQEIYVTYRFPFWKYQQMMRDYYICDDKPLQILTRKTIANSKDKSLYTVYDIAVNDTNVDSIELGRKDKMQKKSVKKGMVNFVWDETGIWDGTDEWPGINRSNEFEGTAYASDGTALYMLQYEADKYVWKNVK